jgi:hypothetical protein
MKRAYCITFVLTISISTAGAAWPQTPPPPAAPAPETSHTGCVMRTEAGDYTLTQEHACSVLQGKKVNPALIGHLVTLRGSVQEATGTTPRTITASSITTVGNACSEACSPHPPGHRGLGHEKPGSEGGTPGVTSNPHPQ